MAAAAACSRSALATGCLRALGGLSARRRCQRVLLNAIKALYRASVAAAGPVTPGRVQSSTAGQLGSEEWVGG